MAKYQDVLELVDKVSQPLKKINNNMQKVSAIAKKTTKAIAGISAGIMAVGGAIVAGANKVADYGDRIDKMSQKIGMSRKSFQEWDYIMSQNGGSVDNLQMGYKTLTTQIGNAQKGSKDTLKAFQTLGIKIKDNNGQLRSSDAVFNDAIKSLQKMTNQTQRNIIGNKLFGRSYAELLPLINQSAEATDQLREKANKLGLVMSDKDIKSAVDFKDTMDTLTRFMQAQMNKAIVPLLPKLQELANKFIENKDSIQKVFEILGKVMLKFVDFLGFIGRNTWVLKTLVSVLVGLGAVALWGAIVAGISSMTGALVALGVTSNIALAGIPLIIGGIATAITALALNWNKVWNGIKNTTLTVVNFITKVIDNLFQKIGFIAKVIPAFKSLGIANDLLKSVSNSSTNNTTNNTTNNNQSYVTNNYGLGMGSLIPNVT